MTEGLWTVVHARNALGGPVVPGAFTIQVGELSYATNFSYTADLVDGSTFSFSMPANLEQAAAVVPRVSDVFAIRNGVYMQRFRVVGRQMTENNGVWTANYSCVDYKGLTKNLVIHDWHTRVFASPTEQSLICWTWLNESQAAVYGDWNLLRGRIPATTHNRVRDAVDEVPPYPAGKPIHEAIQELADLEDGFYWDIEPAGPGNFADEPENLYFNVWNYDEGGRNQHEGGTLGQDWAPLILDSPGIYTGVTHTVTSEKYLNVLYYWGGFSGTGADIGTEDVTPPYAWYPSSQDPDDSAGTPYEGRWERSESNTDLGALQSVQERASRFYSEAYNDPAEITGAIARGKWLGRDQMWIGDKARVVISVPLVRIVNGSPVTIPGEYALSVNDVVEVKAISITVDNNGVENVSVTVQRSPRERRKSFYELNARVSKIERPRY